MESETLEERLDLGTDDIAEHAVATSKGYKYELKGFGYEMKDDDGMIDPLDELLDAYQGFLRAGMVELADQAMMLVHDLQTIMVGKVRDTEKGHSMDMGYMNPIGCLSQAYLALVMRPDTRELARKVLAVMDEAARMMAGGSKDETTSTDDSDGRGMVAGGYHDDTDVRREIRVVYDQFCVYSETGRSFGCYASREEAQRRLDQIEQFAKTTVRPESVKQLVALHDATHQMPHVTPAIKEVHDLISDELEVMHKLSEPYAIPTIVKEAMLTRLDQGFVSKAAEYRYTLGPAYVPDREDAHGEFTDTDTLQRAMWDWVRKGDRTIYLQHSDKAAGEMVEMMTMPFPLEAELMVPHQGVTKYEFPADTPFLGVVWEPWAWELVKSGELRGYSIGGSAKRVEADLPVESLV